MIILCPNMQFANALEDTVKAKMLFMQRGKPWLLNDDDDGGQERRERGDGGKRREEDQAWLQGFRER